MLGRWLTCEDGPIVLEAERVGGADTKLTHGGLINLIIIYKYPILMLFPDVVGDVSAGDDKEEREGAGVQIAADTVGEFVAPLPRRGQSREPGIPRPLILSGHGSTERLSGKGWGCPRKPLSEGGLRHPDSRLTQPINLQAFPASYPPLPG